MTVRRYSVAYNQHVWLGLPVVGVFVAFGGRQFYRWLGSEQRSPYELAFWVFWFGIMFFVAFQFLTSARAIIVHEGDHLEFVSILERQRINASDIRSVRLTQGRSMQFRISHASGKIYLAGPFNDFHQFVSELKQANPGVELVGC